MKWVVLMFELLYFDVIEVVWCILEGGEVMVGVVVDMMYVDLLCSSWLIFEFVQGEFFVCLVLQVDVCCVVVELIDKVCVYFCEVQSVKCDFIEFIVVDWSFEDIVYFGWFYFKFVDGFEVWVKFFEV